jgi:RNA polymerase sigma factor (sigma-70 family)
MATPTFAPLLRQLQPILSHGLADLSDSELLARFSSLRDESAFAALVRRHGPMVFGVCRRVLRDRHAAEDALQATFLVLARKAGRLHTPTSLAPWLYGVASRVAARARLEAARRRCRERHATMHEAIDPTEEAVWRDLRPILDQEINGLPARYRVPVVLCYLTGQTNAEAARQLGCSRGTIATRLARAREQLRQRLTRRGLGLATGLTAVVLEQRLRAEALPRSLEIVTVQAASLFAAGPGTAVGAISARAASWAEGVARIMLLSKLKLVAVGFVAVVLLGAGLGGMRYRAAADELAPGQDDPPAEERLPAEVGKKLEPPAPVVQVGPFPVAEEDETEPAAYRTANFEVWAPTKQLAQVIGRAAEQHRKALALLWLGHELADWQQLCHIRVQLTDRRPSSSTTMQFEGGRLITAGDMVLEGSRRAVLLDLLPHEITHTVLAHGRGAPYPRWADEGAALLAETAASRARQETLVQTLQGTDRWLPLRDLLPMKHYPTDVTAMFAQGYSLTEFLVGQKGRATFLAFLAQGPRDGWDRAVKRHYGYDTVADLERSWLLQVRRPRADRDEDRPASWAERLFDRRSWDFGPVARGELPTHSFGLVNRTDEPVHIAAVRSSCGCASVQRYQSTLMPGQQSVLAVELDTRRFVGPKTVTFYVQFDRPRVAEVVLTVRADSRPDATDPESDSVPAQRARLKELEKRLRDLQQEIDSLRRQLGSELPTPERTAPETEVYHINRRTFRIRFAPGKALHSPVKEVVLFASTDRGRTWRQMATAAPDEESFTCSVPADGLYWFSVACVDRQGKREPSPSQMEAVIKVHVGPGRDRNSTADDQ